MADEKQVRITLTGGPYSQIAVPGTSLRLSRGGSAVTTQSVAETLTKALGSKSLPGLEREHVKIEALEEPEEPKEPTEPKEPEETPLPENFPHAAELAANDVGTVEALQAQLDELESLEGIGESKAGDIREAYEALTEEDEE